MTPNITPEAKPGETLWGLGQGGLRTKSVSKTKLLVLLVGILTNSSSIWTIRSDVEILFLKRDFIAKNTIKSLSYQKQGTGV